MYITCMSLSSNIQFGSDGKASVYNAGDLDSIPGSNPWVGKIRWRRKWQSTPVLLPGKSHGQRSLIGYSSGSRKESDTTERLHFHFHLNIITLIKDCKSFPRRSTTNPEQILSISNFLQSSETSYHLYIF